MKQMVYSWLQRYLNRSPERRRRLWKSLDSEFGAKRNHAELVHRKWPQLRFAPPGHFYSPYPEVEEALKHRKQLIEQRLTCLPDVEMFPEEQIALTHVLAPYYEEFDWPASASEGRHYHADNDQFGAADAAALYAMVKHLAPRRIIEIGSGFSSGLMLDYNALGRGTPVDLTFIEPYPKRLKAMMAGKAAGSHRLIEKPVQQVDLVEFDALAAGDILFVDSSHVSKTGSDLNHIMFDVLPRLPAGVFVHFHDIAWPFEYPEGWIREGRAWNENYLLRAFLSYNSAWKTVLFGSFLLSVHRAEVSASMRKIGFGGYLWIQRTN